MRRARLFKNACGTYDLMFSGVTVEETRELVRLTGAPGKPESFAELNEQLFDNASGLPIIHLRNPIVIGKIE